MVLALGRMLEAPDAVAVEFFRTLAGPLVMVLLVLSRRPFLGFDDGVVLACSFCWCRNNRSRRAKHRVHSLHSKGFSLVCDLSWRFRCSSLAKDLVHTVQTCGRGLSVFGAGWSPFVAGAVALSVKI